MTERKRISLLAVVATVLLLVAVAAHAQLRGVTPQAPVVLSGGDFGFRIEGMKGDTPVGVLVVRRNGQWVQADLGGTGVKQLTLR